MTKFFDRDDLGGKYRQISPNRYVWWFFADRKNGWCASIHDQDGNGIGQDASYAVDQFEAVIQAIRMMDKGE